MNVAGEGELLGNIYVDSGTRTIDHRYFFKVIPFDPETQGRLNPSFFVDSMWADTSSLVVWMLNYTDPAGGGLCGGSVADYANSTNISDEAHKPGPGLTASGKEKHCIRPGRYRIQLVHNGTIVEGKNFVIDYLAVAKTATGAPVQIANSTRGGVIEHVEPIHYDDANPWTDTYINFDVEGGSYTETAVLYGQNIGIDTLRTTFSDDASLTGYDAEYFRFSVAASSTSWNLNGGQVTGEYLTRLFYDVGNVHVDNQTNYYDAKSEYSAQKAAGIMRAHSFGKHVESSRTATVALEMMLPDDSADGPTNTSRSVAITRFACSPTFQYQTSFREADQYAGIGCSARGANIRYSWEFEPGVWTPETADTLHDFPGYYTASPNPRSARLKVRSTATGFTSVSPVSTMTLRDSIMTVSGPPDVWDKTTQTYTSSRRGHWYERWNPDRTWYNATVIMTDTMRRIWPSGNYTVELRAESLSYNVLRRGRVSISVSNDDMLALNSSGSTQTLSGDNWGLFGGGPWLSSGTASMPKLVRFYELMGMHDQSTRFRTPNWLTSSEGSTHQANGMSVSMTPSASSTANARLVDFLVTPAASGESFAFGIALDPDLGANAADDESGYDPSRGLVYVNDKSAAVGYMLLNASKNALYSVDQFGTRRFAPVLAKTAWELHRTAGTRLQTGRSDVQFVLSAAPASTANTYTLVIVRGATVADLRSRADEVLAAVR